MGLEWYPSLAVRKLSQRRGRICFFLGDMCFEKLLTCVGCVSVRTGL